MTAPIDEAVPSDVQHCESREGLRGLEIHVCVCAIGIPLHTHACTFSAPPPRRQRGDQHGRMSSNGSTNLGLEH